MWRSIRKLYTDTQIATARKLQIGLMTISVIISPLACFCGATSNEKEEVVDLFELVRSGDEVRLRNALDAGASSETRTKHNETTLLMMASRLGNVRIVSLLLAKNANVHSSDSVGKNALMYAAESGKNSVIDILVKAGADINTKAKFGSTALILAAANGHTEAIKSLVLHGANVDAKTKHGTTALMLAASSGKAESVKVLLSAGADPSLKDNSGATALQVAFAAGNKEVIKLLGGSSLSPLSIIVSALALGLSLIVVTWFKKLRLVRLMFIVQVVCYVIVVAFIFWSINENMPFLFWANSILMFLGCFFIIVTMVLGVRSYLSPRGA